jgi:hypothetical protein
MRPGARAIARTVKKLRSQRPAAPAEPRSTPDTAGVRGR